MTDIGSPAFTTVEAVRAAIGVDEADIPDASILAAELDQELALDLSAWVVDYEAKLDVQSPTPEQKLLQMALRAYCKWWCALEYIQKVLAHPQLYGDGKQEMRRFTNFDWTELAATAAAKVEQYRKKILKLDPDATTSTSSRLSMIAAASPSYDPITGETT